MSFVNALALVLCVIGGCLTYLYLGPLSGYIHIWAIFIATAMGVALGGSNEAFKNMTICAIAGVIIAWIGSMIIINVPLAATLTLPVWGGIVVGVIRSTSPRTSSVPPFYAARCHRAGLASPPGRRLGVTNLAVSSSGDTGGGYGNSTCSAA